MFVLNQDDLSIYVTRGDAIEFPVSKEDGGERYVFQPGDTVRIKVFKKKACENVVFFKDFEVSSEMETVQITLTGRDTKIGEVISKPVDYWYEVELNPETNPQTFIGYDEEGPRIFRLFPEGKDLTEGELPDEETRSEVTQIITAAVDKYMEKNGGILYTEQKLTEEQKAQARENIGAMQAGIQKGLAINSTEDPHADVVFETEIRKSGIAALTLYSGGYEVGAELPTILSGLADGEEDNDAATVRQVNATFADLPIKYINSSTPENWVVLRNLESGIYQLIGTFKYAEDIDNLLAISEKRLALIKKDEINKYTAVRILGATGADSVLRIEDTIYTRYDIANLKMLTTDNIVDTLDSTADDNHIPTAKAVYDYVRDIETSLDRIIEIQESLIGGGTK